MDVHKIKRPQKEGQGRISTLEDNSQSYNKLDINSLETNNLSISLRKQTGYHHSSKNDYSATEDMSNENQNMRMSQSFDDRALAHEQGDLDQFKDMSRSQIPKSSILKANKNRPIAPRTDRHGTIINPENKAYKVSFADNITKDKEKIADVYVVESYKRFNAENTHGAQPGCCIIM